MGAAVDTGYGGAVTFGTSGFTAQIVDTGHDGIAREALDVSHQASPLPTGGNFGGREYTPQDLVDPGELTLTIHHNPDTYPPVNAAAEQVEVEFKPSGGDTTGAKIAGLGFITGYSYTKNVDEKMEGTLTVKYSGVVTVTPGSA